MLQPNLHLITSMTSALFADVSAVACASVLFMSSHADAFVVNWLPGCFVPCPSQRNEKCFSSC